MKTTLKSPFLGGNYLVTLIIADLVLTAFQVVVPLKVQASWHSFVAEGAKILGFFN